MARVVSIHQANFFHYEGVLEKIRQSDIFVALAHVQFTRGNYHNRFKHHGRWYTMSVNQSLEPLAHKLYKNAKEDWTTIKRRLPKYPWLCHFDNCIEADLVETNVRILAKLCAHLGITQTMIKQDYPSELTKSERLLHLCQHFEATEYLSGPSGLKYIDVDIFKRAGISVRFQEPTKRRSAIELLEERLS